MFSLVLCLGILAVVGDIELPDMEKSLAIASIYIYYIAYFNFKSQARSLHINSIWIATVILLSFFLPINNLYRWTLFGIISLIFILIQKKRIEHLRLPILKPTAIYFVISVILKILLVKIHLIVQFLSFGYDNAFHLMVYRGFRETSWLPVKYISSWWSDFGLFESTPIGSSALFSFLSSAIIGGNQNAIYETAAFFLINLIILILIPVFGIKLILKVVHTSNSKIRRYNLIFGFIVTISLTAGTFFTNGFPPYNLAILVIFMVLVDVERTTGNNSKLLTVSAAIFCLILITPAPVAFLLLPAVLLLINVLKTEMGKKHHKELFFSILVIFFLAFTSLYSFRGSSATLGWRQILAPGGVDEPNRQLTILLLVAYTIYVLLNFFLRKRDFLFLVTISGTSSMLILVSLNLIYTGKIQYYAVKQFYVWLVIISILIYRYLFSQAVQPRYIKNQSIAMVFSFVPMAAVILNLIVSNGFMQNLPNSLLAIANHQNATNYVVDGFKQVQLSKEDLTPDKTCIFYRVGIEESDLNSRWANALSNPIFMSENCFGVYWNSSGMSLEEIASRAKINKTKFVFVLSPDSSVKFKDVVDKNDYFQIGKELQMNGSSSD